MKNGIVAGFPVVDVRVTLYDGSHHEVDSSEVAFRVAGGAGFRDGPRRAKPVILEPMMKVDVSTPDERLGDVMGDISRRRGTVQGMEESAGGQVVRAEVPLAEMFGYATDLRSLTQGRATFNMEFRRYLEGSGRSGRNRHSTKTTSHCGESSVGQGEVRAHQAARERRDDRARGSRQDDPDRGDHAGDGVASWRGREGFRRDRQRAGGEGAGDHDRDGARGIRESGAPLRARRLSGPCGLREEHDHGCGADGRRDPGGVGGGRPDAPDAESTSCWRARWGFRTSWCT